MLRVCLTGGIASGKSLVTAQFRDLGVPVADSDEAARAVVEPGSTGLARVVETFGDDVLTDDGTLDRSALRARVFSDDDARKRLESILHPLIGEHVTTLMESWANAGETYALQSVPLLVETGMHRECTRVLVVDAPSIVQVNRLMRRDRCSAEEARAILARQASRWERLAVATDIIDNGDAVDPVIAVQPQVHALHRKLSILAHFPGAL